MNIGFEIVKKIEIIPIISNAVLSPTRNERQNLESAADGSSGADINLERYSWGKRTKDRGFNRSGKEIKR
jgi:hypothetical protein